MSSLTQEEKFIVSSFRAMFGCIGTPLGTMDPRDKKMILLLVNIRALYDKFSLPWENYDLSGAPKIEFLDAIDGFMEVEGVTPSDPEFEKCKIVVAFLMVVIKHQHLLNAEDHQQLWAAFRDLVPAAKKVPKLYPRVVDSDEEDDD